MKEMIIKVLFYIWFLSLCSVIMFIPLYTIGMFVGIVSLLVGEDFTVMAITKVCLFISVFTSLYGMWISNDRVEKTYNNIRKRRI